MHTENGPIAKLMGLFIPQKTLADPDGTIDGITDMHKDAITAVFEYPSTETLETIVRIDREPIFSNS
jgi:hypothetical protein